MARPIVPAMPPFGQLLSSIRVIALLTLGSRLLGLLREAVFGYYFSTSELMSAYRIAFLVPNLARRLFGEGALSSALIPTLTTSLSEEGEEASRRFVGRLLAVLTAGLVVLVLAAEAVIAAWRTIRDDPALAFAAALMPYMAFICTVAVASGVLHVRRHFATPAGVPMILNVCVVLGTVGGACWLGLHGVSLMYVVCGSVLVAGVLQMVATAAALRAVSFFPIFCGPWRDPRIRALLILMVPMVIGLSAVQINTLADYLIAYLFIQVDDQRVGPAVLGYAQTLYQLPLGVFGISVATAIFPLLSRKAAQGNPREVAHVVRRGIQLALFMALPASAGLVLVARPLVATLFERGEFDAWDTNRVATTLVFYSLGLAAYFAQHVLVRAFYAMRDSRTPAKVAIYAVGLNFAMNLALVFVMEERGLALATACCAAFQVAWLAATLRHRLPELAWRSLLRPVAKMCAATGIMSVLLKVAVPPVFGDGHADASPLIRLTILVVVGVVTYGLAARALGIEEVGMVLPPIRKGRGEPAPDQTDQAE